MELLLFKRPPAKKARPVLLFFLLFFVFYLPASAQDITVNGRVTKGDSALAGVTVTVKNTSNAKQTDNDGNFSIVVPANGTLVFSSIGFITQEIKVANRTSIYVGMQTLNQQLSEGVDNHSGIRSYSVYVSINDSAYILWETTDSLQMTFPVKKGNSYKFYTVATDNVGNIENDAATADQVLSVSLPVTFRDFDVFKRNDKAELIWSTASEQNNRGFEILRGKDNNNMTPIGFVNGAGTSNSVNRYTFRDDSPFEGINYYRLKQVDLDGKISYSAVRYLTFTKTGYLTVMPNPVTDRLFIGINAGLISEIQITDVNGRAVWQKMHINTSSISFTLVQLPKGIYFIRLTDSNGKQSTQKLIKQ